MENLDTPQSQLRPQAATSTADAVPGSQTAEAAAARRSSNLAFSFLSLDSGQRQAMRVFYDFCRRVDDVADDRERPDADKAAELAQWRREVTLACQQAGVPTSAANVSASVAGAANVSTGAAAGQRADAVGRQPAGAATGQNNPGATVADYALSLRYCGEMVEVIRRYRLREADLLAIVDGVSMDIGSPRYETFEDLRAYCYGVASAVGLCCVRIFGCTSERIDAFAEALGYALQFTNILRDVVEDYVEMGRVYLPQAELRAFGVKEADLAAPADNERCRRLFALCHYRATHFFAKARRLLPEEDRDKLKAALVMEAFYRDILAKIKASDFRLTQKRVRLGKGRKFALLLRSLWQGRRPVPACQQPCRVAVLGGGVAGISAAIGLGAEGFTPVLYEARPQLGGRAHSFTDASSGITLDNAQHIAMGCYDAFIGFLRRLNIAHKFSAQSAIRVPYRSAGGRQTALNAPNLPAPLHLLVALVGLKAITWQDRFAIIRLGAVIRFGREPAAELTAAQWLRKHGQSKGAINALWEPFCLAALNTPLETSSARVLAETLRRSLLGARDSAAIWVADVPLSELFDPEAELYLNAIGGALHRQCGIQALEANASGHKLCAAITRRGERIEADVFVSALPWVALSKLLPPDSRLKTKIDQLRTSPIIGIHLICDTKLFDNAEKFVGLLESPLHWVFDRTEALPEAERSQGKRLYALVASVAGEWIDLKKDALEAKVRRELEKYFPDTVSAQMPIERIVTYKSLDATFESTPEAEMLRPAADGSDSPWSNLLLAGDWVIPGLPATLESAAQSGELRNFLHCGKQRGALG